MPYRQCAFKNNAAIAIGIIIPLKTCFHIIVSQKSLHVNVPFIDIQAYILHMALHGCSGQLLHQHLSKFR